MSGERGVQLPLGVQEFEEWLEGEAVRLREVSGGDPETIKAIVDGAWNTFVAAGERIEHDWRTGDYITLVKRGYMERKWALVECLMSNEGLGEARTGFMDRVLSVCEKDMAERRFLYFGVRGERMELASVDVQEKWRGMIAQDLRRLPEVAEVQSLRLGILQLGYATWVGDEVYPEVKAITVETGIGREHLGLRDERQNAHYKAKEIMAAMMVGRLRRGEAEWFLGEMDTMPLQVGWDAVRRQVWRDVFVAMVDEEGGYGELTLEGRNMLVEKLLADEHVRKDDISFYWVQWSDLRSDLLVAGVEMLSDSRVDRQLGPRFSGDGVDYLLLAIASGKRVDLGDIQPARAHQFLTTLGEYDVAVVAAARKHLGRVRDRDFLPAGDLLGVYSIDNILMQKQWSGLMESYLLEMDKGTYVFSLERYNQDYTAMRSEVVPAAAAVNAKMIRLGMVEDIGELGATAEWLPRLIDVYMRDRSMTLKKWLDDVVEKFVGYVRGGNHPESVWEEMEKINGWEPGLSFITNAYRKILETIPMLKQSGAQDATAQANAGEHD